MDSLLSNLKILDFTTLLPGPFATMMLADMGADVLRIESPTRVDLLRFLPPFLDKEGKYSYGHAYLNRNKKSLALDLKNKDSFSIVEKLIMEYDIVVEQFRPGVMDRLGLSYGKLSSINPKIIYCSLTGYGQTGPSKDKPGHDINYLSAAGVMSYSGRKSTGPILMGVQVADVGGGSYNSIVGILAAVIHRMTTGKGQHIDVSMTDCLFPYQMVAASRVFGGEDHPDYENDRLNGGSLYDFYKTSDGKYVSFGGIEPQFFINFCDILGLDDLKPAGIDQPGNLENAKKKIADVFKTETQDYWVEKFKDIDVCFEPVLTFAEATESDHAKSRELVVEVEGPEGKKVNQLAMPIKFSEFKPEYDDYGHQLGEDTFDVMKSLGYSDTEIDEIKSKGVFGPA